MHTINYTMTHFINIFLYLAEQNTSNYCFVFTIFRFTSDFIFPGHGIPVLLEAILKVFPLDTYVSQPVGIYIPNGMMMHVTCIHFLRSDL